MIELLFYGIVSDFSVSSFIKSLSKVAAQGSGTKVLLNSPGGDVNAGWGAIQQFRKFRGQKEVEVHGMASSMMATFLLFADRVEAIQQSTYVLHRASSMGNDLVSKQLVTEANKAFREAFEQKINIERFEEISGVSIDRFFDVDQEPVDVVLNSEKALDIGLIHNIIELNANEFFANQRNLVAAYAKSTKELNANNKEKRSSKMNRDELKEKHPDLYEEIYQDGASSAKPKASAEEPSAQQAVEDERERVKAWMAWNEVDADLVKEGIKSGKAITASQREELNVKALKVGFTKAAVDGNPKSTSQSDGAEDKGNESDGKEFETAVRAQLGLKTVA